MPCGFVHGVEREGEYHQQSAQGQQDHARMRVCIFTDVIEGQQRILKRKHQYSHSRRVDEADSKRRHEGLFDALVVATTVQYAHQRLAGVECAASHGANDAPQRLDDGHQRQHAGSVREG